MAALAGVLLAASFPPPGLAPLAWIAPWPLLAALRGRGAPARLGLGALAGMVWAGGTVIPWLFPAARTHLTAGPLGAATLTAAAAWLYGGLYLAAFAFVYPLLPRPRWLAAPLGWVLLEQVRTRALGGAPWALLGHSQHAFLALAQVAELTGVTGISFLVLLPAAAMVETGRVRLLGLAAAAAALAAAAAFGAARLQAYPAGPSPGPELVVQVVGGHNLAAEPVAAYLAATASLPPAALTVWPEAAVPGYLQEDATTAAAIAATARAHGWLLLGAPRYEGHGPARRYFNSALLLDPGGHQRGVYDKHRLVPFAERSPWPFVNLVDRPFSPGNAQGVLATDRLRIGPLICWEAIFPEPARTYARAGVDVLVNLTSDQDLGVGALQQLAFSRFRTIETRRWLVRASGTGPAQLIDPAGRVRREATLRLPPRDPDDTTFYVRYGEVFAWGSALLLLGLFAIEARRRAPSPAAGGHPPRGALA